MYLSGHMRWAHLSGGLFKSLPKVCRAPSSSAPTSTAAKQPEEEAPVDGVRPARPSPAVEPPGPKTKLVSAAFAALKRSKHVNPIDERIAEAKAPEDLLALSQTSILTRKQALKIVSSLAEWSANGKVKVANFETDPRFISLCQMLGRPSSVSSEVSLKKKSFKNDDLSVVLGVTGDDEAAKLISTITLPQMVKVFATLASKKRRSLPLLRSLSFNISKSSERLNVKYGGDILYSMASLSFPDEVLLEKVCLDLTQCIPQCQKSSVIGSICTSLGLLKYKNIDLLDCLCDWMLKKADISRAQDVLAFLLTIAILDFTPSNSSELFKVILPHLSPDELPSATSWLDAVWALVILGKVNNDHLASVLDPQFIGRLIPSQLEEISIPCKKKLLIINGVANLTKGYNGPLLKKDAGFNHVALARSKEKQILVDSVFDALMNLLPSNIYLRKDVDSGMGFLIDGECLFDSKLTPLPVVDKKTGQPLVNKSSKATRVAIMVWDYYNTVRGHGGLAGPSRLLANLVEQQGYKTLSIPHTEFNPKDKLTLRVQYLEKGLKQLVRGGPS